MLFSFESKWLKDRLRYGIGTGLSTGLKAHCEVLCAKIKTLLASSDQSIRVEHAIGLLGGVADDVQVRERL
jgi:hypothetical protein